MHQQRELSGVGKASLPKLLESTGDFFGDCYGFQRNACQDFFCLSVGLSTAEKNTDPARSASENGDIKVPGKVHH